jgi:hypothetical protein
VWLLCLAFPIAAQEPSDATYSRLNTFSGFSEYSNDSSHIILGNAENRKIGAIGFQYQRRLVNRRLWNFSFTAEIRPGMLESDPTLIETVTYKLPPPPITVPYPETPVVVCRGATYTLTGQSPTGQQFSNVVTDTCARRTVIEQGFSPAGVRFNLMPRHRLQLTFSSFAGYMFSTQDVPIPDAGSFNYTFEFGGGLEFFSSRTRSVRLEYQVQHFSNKQTADQNPGVDSGLIKLTYAFGR